MANKKGAIAHKTMERLFASEPIHTHGSYWIVGYPSEDGTAVKLRIDRDECGRMIYGVAKLYAMWDEEQQDIMLDWELWKINSKLLEQIAEKYAIQFCTENYIKTHPINTPQAVKPTAPTPKQEPIVVETRAEKPKPQVDDTIINITSFTLKETELGLTIVFTTDTGKTLIGRYGGTKGQTTTITTTTTTIIK